MIAVFDGPSSNPANQRTNNIGVHAFSATQEGASSGPQSFIIKNIGSADLTGLAVSGAGVNSNNFTVGALGATTLAPDATTTFIAEFLPTAHAQFSAVLKIASADPDNNPFSSMSAESE